MKSKDKDKDKDKEIVVDFDVKDVLYKCSLTAKMTEINEIENMLLKKYSEVNRTTEQRETLTEINNMIRSRYNAYGKISDQLNGQKVDITV